MSASSSTKNLNDGSVSDWRIFFNVMCKERISKYFAGPMMFLLVSDPDVMKAVLSTDNFTERPFIFDFFRCPNGLMTAKCKIEH